MHADRDLPLYALRTFVAVADRGGFTPAASFLGMTQPTVSQQVKKLEALCGGALIDRGGKTIRLTESGARMLEYARRIVDLNDEAMATVAQPSIVGSLRLGLPHEFTFSLLPRLVGAFSQIHPGVVVEVECQLSRDLLTNIDDYDIVLALHLPGDGGGGKLLRSEPLCWAAHADYQPASDTPILIAAAPHPCIYRQVLERRLAEYRAGWMLYLTSTSYGAICGAVSSGVGVTLLAQNVVPEGLTPIQLPGIEDLKSLELRLHRASREENPAINTFESFVIERVAERSP